MLNLQEIPKLEEQPLIPKEEQICTQCAKKKDVDDFGWRYCYVQRLEICKTCRNSNAKRATRVAKFARFNSVTMMKWSKAR